MFSIVSKNKGRMINVRLNDETHFEFKAAALLRGGTMSALLHQYIVKMIREEKERDRGEFNRALKAVKIEALNGQPIDVSDEPLIDPNFPDQKIRNDGFHITDEGLDNAIIVGRAADSSAKERKKVG